MDVGWWLMVTYLLIGWRHYDVTGLRHNTTSDLVLPQRLLLIYVVLAGVARERSLPENTSGWKHHDYDWTPSRQSVLLPQPYIPLSPHLNHLFLQPHFPSWSSSRSTPSTSYSPVSSSSSSISLTSYFPVWSYSSSTPSTSHSLVSPDSSSFSSTSLTSYFPASSSFSCHSLDSFCRLSLVKKSASRLVFFSRLSYSSWWSVTWCHKRPSTFHC